MTKQSSSIGKKIAQKKRSGRVEFIAQIEEIKVAMEEGWTAKDIWEELKREKKISFSYQMFMRYVGHLINGSTRSVKSTSAVGLLGGTEDAAPPQLGKQYGPIKAASKETTQVVRPDNAKDVPDSDLY